MSDLHSTVSIDTIYLEPAVKTYCRGQEILGRFPAARCIEVPSHWQIPELHGNTGLAEDWIRTKRTTLVLGVKKGLAMRPDGRSADFIAPSTSNGCAMACAYCYVPRRKGYANPISLFVNCEEIVQAITRHSKKLGPKLEPNQIDPVDWVYDIGENGDLSIDALLSDNVRDLVAMLRAVPNAKGSFATKAVNRDLLDYDPQGKTRVRFSLMPERVAHVVDVRTTPMAERIAAIDDFVQAGYDVHVNFSPVILYAGWEADYRLLFEQVDAVLSKSSKKQLKAEIIFLTHNTALHEVNLRWHPRAEDWLWTPETQEIKISENGGINLRYRAGWKGKWITIFKVLLNEIMPYCEIRYAF